jgi:hypothetical protein
MSVLDDLRYWRDKMVTDYGPIKLANELTDQITAFPGGTGFLAGEPSHRPVNSLLCRPPRYRRSLRHMVFNAAYVTRAFRS